MTRQSHHGLGLVLLFIMALEHGDLTLEVRQRCRAWSMMMVGSTYNTAISIKEVDTTIVVRGA